MKKNLVDFPANSYPRFPLSKLIAPIFLDQHTFDLPKNAPRKEVTSIPGFSRLSAEQAYQDIEELIGNGIDNILIYPLADSSQIDLDTSPETVLDPNLFLLSFTREVRRRYPGLNVILDLCLCHFNNQSQCGMLCNGRVENDRSLALLSQMAVNFSAAGAHALMISGMIDGATGTVRRTLEDAGYTDMILMVQSAKLDSAFYGPFQKIQSQKVAHNLKGTYQVEPGNKNQIQRELQLDIEEGADILVLKPGGNSLDVLPLLPTQDRPPIFSYMTGGEYSMLYQRLRGNTQQRIETINDYFLNLERSGFDAIISYAAPEYARAQAILTAAPDHERPYVQVQSQQ